VAELGLVALLRFRECVHCCAVTMLSHTGMNCWKKSPLSKRICSMNLRAWCSFTNMKAVTININT
jgi:hypothetical protein